MKKFLTILLTVILTAAIAIGGTVAYLTDTEGAVNTMTLGNVYIDQIESEFDENGELVQFEQDKPLYPYTGSLGWEVDETLGNAWRKFTMNNVVDKYVTVKNTGASDAYVRTVIALEMGTFAYDEFTMIGVSVNAADGDEFDFPGTWVWEEINEVTINGRKYNVMVATHQTSLKPDEETIPSLLQVYLKDTATNEDVEKLDGNANGKYDIIVLSQAVQTEGFEDADGNGTAADEALTAGFGEINAENIEGWLKELEATASATETP